MQRSDKQIEASRLNGARSRGPITPEGKLRSSQNAARHQALARSISLQLEDPTLFLDKLTGFCGMYQPVGPVENSLVESMATAKWKMDRYELAEKVLVDLQCNEERIDPPAYPHGGLAVIAKAVAHLVGDERAIKSLNQTIALLDRQFNRNLNMLMKVQEYRRRNPPVPDAIEPQPSIDSSADASPVPEVTDVQPLPAPETAFTTVSNQETQKRTHNLFQMKPFTEAGLPQPEAPTTPDGSELRVMGVKAG